VLLRARAAEDGEVAEGRGASLVKHLDGREAAAVDDTDRAAVRRGVSDGLGAYQAAGSADILHRHISAQHLGKVGRPAVWTRRRSRLPVSRGRST
jgi:hypothetical protein